MNNFQQKSNNAILVFFSAISSSSSAGAGVYNSNTFGSQSYSPKYPYSNNYVGYANAGAYPNYAAYPDPYALQASFQQYFNALSAYNAKYDPSFMFDSRDSKLFTQNAFDIGNFSLGLDPVEIPQKSLKNKIIDE